MPRLSVSIAFILALALTLLAFIVSDTTVLVALAAFSTLLPAKGIKKIYWVYIFLLVSLIGVFVNALMFANTGAPVLEFHGFTIRANAVEGFVRVTLRLLIIAGAGAWFIASYTPFEIARGLEKELGIPKGVSFAIAYAFRLIPLVARDLAEIQNVRRERGKRTIPLLPSDLASILTPLLRTGYERAVWTGISIELRGFSLRKIRREFKLVYR
ncbi:energy-coupling factor transporter transmembrane component T [Thermogladius sp. 4427co]|uniref:energy-coupling factor transporter transmembrane component T n=1 Tax=Thermogladius sp. 4427co TaxID=3450718 RepID=UPI003F799DE1